MTRFINAKNFLCYRVYDYDKILGFRKGRGAVGSRMRMGLICANEMHECWVLYGVLQSSGKL